MISRARRAYAAYAPIIMSKKISKSTSAPKTEKPAKAKAAKVKSEKPAKAKAAKKVPAKKAAKAA